MSSLRGQLVNCFTTLLPNTLKFFVEKMREAFALQKLLTFFITKNIGIFKILMNVILTKCYLMMSLVLNNWAQVNKTDLQYSPHLRSVI